MTHIDREGIAQAVPREWWIRRVDSGAVAVSFDFDVMSMLDGDDWHDWTQYGEYTVFGDWWVIKKDGTVNQGAVEQLALAIGWDGNLTSVQGPPPNYLVQLTIKGEEYQGKRRYKAAWMNPGDHVPGPAGATAEEVQAASNRFGSLLRAAATGAARAAKPVPAPPREERQTTAPSSPSGQPAPQGGPMGPEPPPIQDDMRPGGGSGSGGIDDDELPF